MCRNGNLFFLFVCFLAYVCLVINCESSCYVLDVTSVNVIINVCCSLL